MLGLTPLLDAHRLVLTGMLLCVRSVHHADCPRSSTDLTSYVSHELQRTKPPHQAQTDRLTVVDATNCIPQPHVCGISSLGFDHMELLGNTLPVGFRLAPS
jgi:hypothetical protein